MKKRLKIKDIDEAIQCIYNVDIKNKSKKGKEPVFRQIFYYLIEKHIISIGTREIGEYLGMNRSGVYIQLERFKDMLNYPKSCTNEIKAINILEDYLSEKFDLKKDLELYSTLYDKEKHSLVLTIKRLKKNNKRLSNKNFELKKKAEKWQRDLLIR